MNHHLPVNFYAERSMGMDKRKPRNEVPTFISTAAENRCSVSVRILEQDEDGSMIEVKVAVYPKTHVGTVPDHWEIVWTHYKEILNENFWAYIDEHCPEPSWVREAVGNLQLPSAELEDLFRQAAAESG